MTANPVPSVFTDTNISWNTQWAEAEKVAAVLIETFGIAPRTTVVLDANGLLSPTTGCVAVDTFASAAADDMERIAIDLPVGRVVAVCLANAARPVTIKHLVAGGSEDGKIQLAGAVDVVLTSTFRAMLFQRVGNQWVELSLAAAGGLTGTTAPAVAIEGDTTLDPEVHGEFGPAGSDLAVRIIKVKHATNPATPITITVPAGYAARALFAVDLTQSGLVTIAASGTDTINGFAAVEAAGPGAEIPFRPLGGGEFLASAGIKAVATLTDLLNANGEIIRAPIIEDASETVNPNIGDVSGAIAVDYRHGHKVECVLTANATSLTISNWPAAGEEGWISFEWSSGAAGYTWVHPTGTRWPGGTPPTIPAGNNKIHRVMYTSSDGGTTIDGWFGGGDRA